jgi:hypothetical protein
MDMGRLLDSPRSPPQTTKRSSSSLPSPSKIEEQSQHDTTRYVITRTMLLISSVHDTVFCRLVAIQHNTNGLLPRSTQSQSQSNLKCSLEGPRKIIFSLYYFYLIQSIQTFQSSGF